MHLLWNRSATGQLDLVDAAEQAAAQVPVRTAGQDANHAPSASRELSIEALSREGLPLQVSLGCLDEDPSNPRTEFPDSEISALAQDIAQRGILQPIVVLPLGDGRYRVLFGAKRLRAAKEAGLETVPVVIGSKAHDVYAQVAENEKRHGLTPLDLARFMRSRVEAGEANAEIARKMGIDSTTVAHHLALLTLPPVLDEALRSGRCTSPRTLYELAKLHETQPERVMAILNGEREITRRSVASVKKAPRTPRAAPRKATTVPRKSSLAERASQLCARLQSLLGHMTRAEAKVTSDELVMLRRRLADLASRCGAGRQ